LDNRNTALVVEELHKYFGSEEVLKGISLEASEGDVIAMVGASGSGKSTFLRCVNLLEIPTSGKIFVRGELIRMKQDRYGVTVPEDLSSFKDTAPVLPDEEGNYPVPVPGVTRFI